MFHAVSAESDHSDQAEARSVPAADRRLRAHRRLLPAARIHRDIRISRTAGLVHAQFRAGHVRRSVKQLHGIFKRPPLHDA